MECNYFGITLPICESRILVFLLWYNKILYFIVLTILLSRPQSSFVHKHFNGSCNLLNPLSLLICSSYKLRYNLFSYKELQHSHCNLISLNLQRCQYNHLSVTLFVFCFLPLSTCCLTHLPTTKSCKNVLELYETLPSFIPSTN